MQIELNQPKNSNEEKILSLVDKTFSKLSCRMQGVGMYDELKAAIVKAYKMGKVKGKKNKIYKLLNSGVEIV